MTVQNLYTKYLNGEITKQKFLYEVRRDQNLTMISPSNSFDDVVKILKNKSIISEKAHKESTGKQEVEIIAKTIDMVNPYQYSKGMEYELGIMDIPASEGDLSEENIAKAQKKVLTNLTKNPSYYSEKICGKGEVSDEWVEVTKKEIEKIGKGKKNIIREGLGDAQYYKAISAADSAETPMNSVQAIKKFLKKKFKDLDDKNIDYLAKEWAKRALNELFSEGNRKTDPQYKGELKAFLEDNLIWGYTNRIHDIMTGPDQDEAYRELAEFLDDEGIYGYTRRIEQIYADYPYHEHWMNQPDEDETDTLEEGNSEKETGLLVIGRTQIDNNAIGDVLDELGLYGEWNVREGYWMLPEDEENYDSLEEILEQEFATRGINARFEGIFPDKSNKSLEEHGEYFDRVSDMNISQSPLEEKRLRIYEKYAQKFNKTVDEVKAMVDEAIALKDRAGNIQYAKDSTEASNIEKNAKAKGITLSKTAV